MLIHYFFALLFASQCHSSLIISQCVNRNDVSLTFDDGPSIKTTRALMDTLESMSITGTFHIVTRHFDFPDVQVIAREIISRGHLLGYRLEAEWTMQNVTNEGIQGAVDYRLKMIQAATGKKPRFVRTSYNATDLVKNALIASSLIVTIPNFETEDFDDSFSVEKMISRFDSLSFYSSIIVQREFAKDLINTTRLLVAHLRAKGYNIVSLQQCTGIDQVYSEERSISSLKIYSDMQETTTTSTVSGGENHAGGPSPAFGPIVFMAIFAIFLVL